MTHLRDKTDLDKRVALLASTASVLALGMWALRRLNWFATEHPNYPQIDFDYGALALAMTLMMVLALAQFPRRFPRTRTAFMGGALGLTFFVSTVGFALANPLNVEWLFRADWAAHFVGWHLYRNAPWRFPPGVFDTFFYPVGTAVVYTDSLPILAIPLKLVSGSLSPRFQYVGIWLLTNCILQGAFGALLVRCFSPRISVQAIGAGFLLLAPVFLARIDHDTLTTQWLLLASLWLYFRQDQNRSRVLRAWVILASVSALVHPYINVMVLAFACAWYVRAVCVDNSLDVRAAVKNLTLILGATVACFWLSGVFTLRPSGGGVALGVYNANLLTWIDPQYMSRWLPTLPLGGPGQYEGHGYLGLGALALVGVSFLLAIFHGQEKVSPQVLWPLVMVTAVLTLYAFGTRFTLGGTELFDVTPSHLSILGAFRGSGRFIWPSCYLITVLAIAAVAQRGAAFSLPILAIAVVVQLADLSPLHARTFHMRQGVYARATEPVLTDSRWEQLAAGRTRITMVFPHSCGKEAAPYFPFALFAGDHPGMTVNTGYLARFDERSTFAYCNMLRAELESGERRSDYLYIVHPEELDHFRGMSKQPVKCETIEGYTGCVVEG